MRDLCPDLAPQSLCSICSLRWLSSRFEDFMRGQGSSLDVLPSAGLWVELQLVYTGALQMTLETKFNLAKLGKEGSQETESGTETHTLR